MVSTAPVTGQVSNVQRALAASRLGLWPVAFFALAGSAPLTVVAGGSPGGYALTGSIGMPVGYIATGIILAFFAVGYVAMSRHIVNAGAFYTYITQGLGRPAGVASAYIAVIAYNLMQVGLYGGFGVGMVNLVGNNSTYWWQWALIAWFITAISGVLRVEFNGRILAAALVCEVIIVVIFDVVMLNNPAPGTGLAMDALSPGVLLTAAVGPIFVIAIAGFIGFENTVVLSEETRNPRTTVRNATFLALGLAVVLYAVSAWAMSVAAGPGNIVAKASTDFSETVFNLVTPYTGSGIVTAGRILFVTSLFAALLSFHNTVARYLFSLGRERVLPGRLGNASARTGAPTTGSLTQTGIAFAVIVLFAVKGWDPYVQMFFWLTTTSAFGVLLLMMLACAAVMAYFWRRRQQGKKAHPVVPLEESVWTWAVMPAMAMVLLAVTAWATLDHYELLLGVPAGHAAVWALPAVFAVAVVAGVLRAVLLRLRRPHIYSQIGMGAAASNLDAANV